MQHSVNCQNIFSQSFEASIVTQGQTREEISLRSQGKNSTFHQTSRDYYGFTFCYLKQYLKISVKNGSHHEQFQLHSSLYTLSLLMQAQTSAEIGYPQSIDFHNIKNTLVFLNLLKLSNTTSVTPDVLSHNLLLLQLPCDLDSLHSFLESTSSSSSQSGSSLNLGTLLCDLIDCIKVSQTIFVDPSYLKVMLALKMMGMVALIGDEAWYIQMQKVCIKVIELNVPMDQLINEVRNVIVRKGVEVRQEDGVNPLKILMLSPFLMMDIKGQIVKQNQYYQFSIASYVSKEHSEQLIEWGRYLQKIQFDTVLFSILDQVQVDINEPETIVLIAEYFVTFIKVFNEIPIFNHLEHRLRRIAIRVLRNESSSNLSFVSDFFKFSTLSLLQVVENDVQCQFLIIFTRLVDFQDDDEIKPILLSKLLPRLPMIYIEEFIVKGFKYLLEKMKKCETRSTCNQLMSIGIFDKFLDQACLFIAEIIELPQRAKKGEQILLQILVILSKFIQLDKLQQQAQQSQDRIISSITTTLRRSSSFTRNQMSQNSIKLYIEKVAYYLNTLIQKAPQSISKIIASSTFITQQLASFTSHNKGTQEITQIGHLYTTLLATVKKNECHPNFPCYAVDILINCTPDLSIATLLTHFQQKPSNELNLPLRQQALQNFLLKTHASLTNLTMLTLFNQYFPLNYLERLKLFLNLYLSQKDTFEAQLNFLGVSQDNDELDSCCIQDLRYQASQVNNEEVNRNVSRLRVLERIRRQQGAAHGLLVEEIIKIVQRVLGQLSTTYVIPSDQDLIDLTDFKLKTPQTASEIRDNELYFQFDINQEGTLTSIVSNMTNNQWTMTRYFEKLNLLKSVSSYLKNEIVLTYVNESKEQLKLENKSLSENFERIRCLEGILREVCIPLGYNQLGQEISAMLLQSYQLQIQQSQLDQKDHKLSIILQQALLHTYEQRSFKHKQGKKNTQSTHDDVKSVIQQLERVNTDQKLLQLMYGSLNSLYLMGLYKQTLDECFQLEGFISESGSLLTMGQHLMKMKVAIIQIKCLFKLNRHPEVYSLLKKTQELYYQFLSGFNAHSTTKVKMPGGGENNDIEVKQFSLINFIEKYEKLMLTQSISKTEQYQMIRATQVECNITQSFKFDDEFGSTVGAFEALSILREFAKLYSKIRNRAYGISDGFYSLMNKLHLQSSFQIGNFSSFVDYALDLKLLHHPEIMCEPPPFQQLSHTTTQSKRLKCIAQSVSFPPPLMNEYQAFNLPQASAVFYEHISRLFNFDPFKKKAAGLDDLSLVIEGDKVMMKFLIAQCSAQQIAKWLKKKGTDDRLKELIRYKAKFGFEVTQDEASKYCRIIDSVNLESFSEDFIDRYIQLKHLIMTQKYLLNPKDFSQFCYFHYRDLVEHSLQVNQLDVFCTENNSTLLISRLWPLLHLKILSRTFNLKLGPNYSEDQSKSFRQSLSHSFLLQQDDEEMKEDNPKHVAELPNKKEILTPIDYSRLRSHDICQLQRNTLETKIVGISCSKYSMNIIEITVIDSFGDEEFDLNYRIEVRGDLNWYFQEFARMYSRQFMLWKKASYLKKIQQSNESKIVRKEIDEQLQVYCNIFKLFPFFRKAEQSKIRQKFREIDYEMFGMHQNSFVQILFLGRLKDKTLDLKIWHFTHQLRDQLQNLLQTPLTSGQTYYLRQLLISLLSDIIPCHQQENSDLQNINTINLSPQRMSIGHLSKQSLVEVNKAFNTDRIVLIDKFIEVVLFQLKSSKTSKISELIRSTMENIRNSPEYLSSKQVMFEPLHLIVDPLIANFPFENLHVFKPQIENDQRSKHRPNDSEKKLPPQLCSRLPSIEWLHHNRELLKNQHTYFKKCLVVVDPENNLENTKKKFMQFSKKCNVNQQNFSFIFGKEQVSNIAMMDFTESSIYFFNGHGNGIKFIDEIIKELRERSKSPLMLLFGCDSVQFNTPSSLFQPRNKSLEKLMQRSLQSLNLTSPSFSPFVYGSSQTSLSTILDPISYYVQNHIAEVTHKIPEIKQRSQSFSTMATNPLVNEENQINILQLIRDAEEALLVDAGVKGQGVNLDEYYGFGAYMMSYGIPPGVIHTLQFNN